MLCGPQRRPAGRRCVGDAFGLEPGISPAGRVGSRQPAVLFWPFRLPVV